MRDNSDILTEKIGKSSIKTAQTAQTARVQAALAKAEIRDAADNKREELQKRYDEIRASILSHRHYGAGRLINVFPNVSHRDYKELLKDIQEAFRAK